MLRRSRLHRLSWRRAPPAGRFVLLTLVVTVLGAFGVLPRWPGLVQEVALPPLDLFADLRVLMAVSPSYPVFALGVAAAVVVRSAVLAGLAGDGSRGAFLEALQFYGTALVPGLLAAGFEFSGAAALYHWYLWIGMGIALVAMLVMAPGPWRIGDGRKEETPSRAGQLATVAGYLVALFALGAVASVGGKAASVGLVLPSAWLTWRAERRLRQRAGTVRRVAGAVVAVALVALPVVAVVRLPSEGPSPTLRSGSLFLVGGVDSATGAGPIFHLRPPSLGYSCRHTYYFSYAGPGTGVRHAHAACPVRSGKRYSRKDTQRPLAALVSSMRKQLASLAGPVTVVAHSQGAWIAWAALARAPPTGVRDLVMLAPFPRGLVGYPRSGREGPGRVGGDFLRAVSSIGRKFGVATYDPDAPLARQLLAIPGAIARILSHRLAGGVEALAVEPLSDLGLMPEERSIPHASNPCPVRTTHAGVVTAGATAGDITRFFRGRPLPACPLGASWLAILTAPFGVPPSDT